MSRSKFGLFGNRQLSMTSELISFTCFPYRCKGVTTSTLRLIFYGSNRPFQPPIYVLRYSNISSAYKSASLGYGDGLMCPQAVEELVKLVAEQISKRIQLLDERLLPKAVELVENGHTVAVFDVDLFAEQIFSQGAVGLVVERLEKEL